MDGSGRTLRWVFLCSDREAAEGTCWLGPGSALLLERMDHWTEYTRFLTALIVIVDPFAAIPIFLGLTSGYSKVERRLSLDDCHRLHLVG